MSTPFVWTIVKSGGVRYCHEVCRLRSHDAPRACVGLQAFLAQHVPRIRPNEFGMIVDIVRNGFVRVPMRWASSACLILWVVASDADLGSPSARGVRCLRPIVAGLIPCD